MSAPVFGALVIFFAVAFYYHRRVAEWLADRNTKHIDKHRQGQIDRFVDDHEVKP